MATLRPKHRMNFAHGWRLHVSLPWAAPPPGEEQLFTQGDLLFGDDSIDITDAPKPT